MGNTMQCCRDQHEGEDLREKKGKKRGSSSTTDHNIFKQPTAPAYVIESRMSLTQAAKENTQQILQEQKLNGGKQREIEPLAGVPSTFGAENKIILKTGHVNSQSENLDTFGGASFGGGHTKFIGLHASSKTDDELLNRANSGISFNQHKSNNTKTGGNREDDTIKEELPINEEDTILK